MSIEKINELITDIQYDVSILKQVIVELTINNMCDTFDADNVPDIGDAPNADAVHDIDDAPNADAVHDIDDAPDADAVHDIDDVPDADVKYYSVHALESYRLGDKVIDTCNTVLKNVEEMKNNFDEEKDRLCVLINTISRNLPFIEKIKYRAEARGIKLGEFTLYNIPKEAAPFYGDDERIIAIIREYESELSKVVSL